MPFHRNFTYYIDKRKVEIYFSACYIGTFAKGAICVSNLANSYQP